MAGTPASVDLQVIRGDDFSQQFQLVSCDQLNPTAFPSGLITGATVINGATFTPIDLTGSTILSQIRRSTAFAESLLATFTITYDNRTQGLFTLSLPNTTTTTLASNDSATNRYDVQVTDSGNKVSTYLIGEVDITMDVSRP